MWRYIWQKQKNYNICILAAVTVWNIKRIYLLEPKMASLVVKEKRRRPEYSRAVLSYCNFNLYERFNGPNVHQSNRAVPSISEALPVFLASFSEVSFLTSFLYSLKNWLFGNFPLGKCNLKVNLIHRRHSISIASNLFPSFPRRPVVFPFEYPREFSSALSLRTFLLNL